jgi:hypothetical protein
MLGSEEVQSMKGSLAVIAVCIVMGIIYGKLATVYHWYLPPNWLAI